MSFPIFTTILTTLMFKTLLIDAIDFEGSKESSCFEIKETVPLDLTWVMFQKIWYYPIMSRFDLYMTAIDLSGKSAEDLQEDELHSKSCFTFQTEGISFAGKGFNGKKRLYNMTPVQGIMEIYDYSGDPEGEIGGRCYTVLTDNKTYAVSACCTIFDQMTWTVISTVKSLPEETVKHIHDHMEFLGFKREYFETVNYDQCDQNLEKSDEQKIEL